MSVARKLAGIKPTATSQSPPKPQGPVWKGPEVDGVTQSLLSRFLVCRERFRLLVVEGLRPVDSFNARLEFGQMWHVCEEALASSSDWRPALLAYCKAGLATRYPMDREKIDHWYNICKALFPLYVDHWSKNPDVKERTPLFQEQVFDVPYALPSGRKVRLRGKWDSVDLIGSGKTAGIYLQENKTKSSIDANKLTRQLSFDLQTMIYSVALIEGQSLKSLGDRGRLNFRGVRYNVIRRSAHKSVESMLKKIEDDRADGRIGEWFGRWKVEVSEADVLKFRRQCLDPILEQLCDWWEHCDYCRKNGYGMFDPTWVRKGRNESEDRKFQAAHYRHPFGVYNVLDEGGSSDLDAYLESGSEVGLERTTRMFSELE